MPRPKRNKVAPSAPAKLPESLMRAIRADAESKKQEEQAKVERRTSTRRVSKNVSRDYSMSGALGVRNTFPSSQSGRNATNELPDGRDEIATGTVEPEIVPSSIQSEDAQLAKMSSPFAAPSTVQRPIRQRSIMPSANWRTQATPRLDSSALGNFKRRPRQPSILGIGRQDESSLLSSLGGGDSDPFYDELEDFDPAVATPLIRAKTRVQQPLVSVATAIPSSPPSILNSRKRKRGTNEVVSDVLVKRTPSANTDDVSGFIGSSPAQPRNTEADSLELPSLKPDAQMTSATSELVSPETWSDTMAPPQSSPSETSPPSPERIASPKAQKRTRKKAAPVSPLSAKKPSARTRSQKSRALQPLSTAQLQNLLPSRRNKQKSKKDDSFDSSNINSNNEDEASFVPTKRTRASSKQPKTPVKQSGKSKSKATLRDKTNTKSNAVPGSALRKSKLKPGSAIKPRPAARTYARNNRIASGQENEDVFSLQGTQDESDVDDLDLSNSSLEDLDPKAKNELQAIARKFAEVDEWEMEFEEVDASSGSGSGLLLR